jgi:hypothetical protein
MAGEVYESEKDDHMSKNSKVWRVNLSLVWKCTFYQANENSRMKQLKIWHLKQRAAEADPSCEDQQTNETITRAQPCRDWTSFSKFRKTRMARMSLKPPSSVTLVGFLSLVFLGIIQWNLYHRILLVEYYLMVHIILRSHALEPR